MSWNLAMQRSLPQHITYSQSWLDVLEIGNASFTPPAHYIQPELLCGSYKRRNAHQVCRRLQSEQGASVSTNILSHAPLRGILDMTVATRHTKLSWRLRGKRGCLYPLLMLLLRLSGFLWRP